MFREGEKNGGDKGREMNPTGNDVAEILLVTRSGPEEGFWLRHGRGPVRKRKSERRGGGWKGTSNQRGGRFSGEVRAEPIKLGSGAEETSSWEKRAFLGKGEKK